MSDTDIVDHFTRFAAERRKMRMANDVVLRARALLETAA